MIKEVIFPLENSPLDKYIDTTVSFLKDKIRQKNKKVDVNLSNLGESLFFAKLCLTNKNNLHDIVRALIDTGAANSLLHESVVRKYNIPYDPVSLRLCTTNGFDDNAIIGKCHLKFVLHGLNNKQMTRCTNFIISKKLNNLECILGAEFLFSEEKTITLDKSKLTINEKNISFQTTIFSDDTFPLNCQPNNNESIDLTCGSCENNPVYIKNNMIYVKNIVLTSCEDSGVESEHVLAECADLTPFELWEILVPQNNNNNIPTIPLNTDFPPIPPTIDFLTIPPHSIDLPILSISLKSVVDVMSHSVKDVY